MVSGWGAGGAGGGGGGDGGVVVVEVAAGLGGVGVGFLTAGLLEDVVLFFADETPVLETGLFTVLEDLTPELETGFFTADEAPVFAAVEVPVRLTVDDCVVGLGLGGGGGVTTNSSSKGERGCVTNSLLRVKEVKDESA